jgi:hypothetical protein
MQCQHHLLAPEISSFAPKSHREEIGPRLLPTHPKARHLRPHDRLFPVASIAEKENQVGEMAGLSQQT